MLNAKIKKEFRTNGRVTFALDASFVVRQGITVLFGPSGSGKTTILRSIAGIVVPDEGRIELGEHVYFDSETRDQRTDPTPKNWVRLPGLPAVSASDRRAKRRVRNQVGYSQGAARPGNRTCWTCWESPMLPIAALISFRGASSSGLPWRAPWGQTPPFCCSMSRCRHLTRRLACDCWGRSLIYSGNRRSLSSTSHIVRLTRFALGDSALILNAGSIVQEGKPAEVFNAPRDSAVSRAVGSENILAGRFKITTNAKESA